MLSYWLVLGLLFCGVLFILDVLFQIVAHWEEHNRD